MSDTTIDKSSQLFELGKVVATKGVMTNEAVAIEDIQKILNRHVKGDWGSISKEDAQINDAAVKRDIRIVSSYLVPGLTVDCERIKIWCITEADRSVTTVLFPSEY